MENAAKALLISAGILIAILIISMGVYLRTNLNKTSDSYNTQLEAVELQKYNSYFEIYTDVERKNNITAQEIVSLISLTQQMNQETEIHIIGEGNVSNYDEDAKNKLLRGKILTYSEYDETTGTYKTENSFSYVEESIEYDEFGKVIRIKFKEN